MNNKEFISKEINFEGKPLRVETGKLATMTNMSVKISWGDTVILVTAVSGNFNPDIDYFPLNVDYIEKMFATGSVKSSRFVKRDGRGTDEAIIAGRSIDHSIRPLFPEDFSNETQIVVTVLSVDPECDAEFLSMVAVSAALTASDIPWNGPMAPVRVGYVNGEYKLCPTRHTLEEESDLDLIVTFVGKEKRFLGLEAEANILPEEKILGAIEFGRTQSEQIFDLINDFAKAVNPEGIKLEYTSTNPAEDLVAAVSEIATPLIEEAMSLSLDKDALSEKLGSINDLVVTELEGKFKKADMLGVVSDLKREIMQKQILETESRIDGRGLKEIRPLSAEIGVLPRTHGSALFSRGLTQMMTIATLASPSEELLIQDMYGERSKRYMHFYNFPPYSSGETGRVGGYPKNREIGHGMIGEKGLRPVIPSQEEFPYTIIVNSETLSSSGSTSMAATCGSTLALMDAGVPIKEMVAGIGIGLIANKDFSKTLLLTDVAYMEDAFGLLDFKMTGTRNGVTGIQCDMKSAGIPIEYLPKIIERSKEARMQVLDVMEATISEPKKEVSAYAPKAITFKIDAEKIGTVIGSGGKTIKGIQEKTGAEISIEDDGTVTVSSSDKLKAEEAAEIVHALVKDVEVGEIYDGVIEEVVDFGAFVEILPGKNGLLHISEVSNEFVADANDVLKAGDTIKVKVIDTSRDGKIGLSVRALEEGYVPRAKPQRGGRNGSSSRDGRRPNNRRN